MQLHFGFEGAGLGFALGFVPWGVDDGAGARSAGEGSAACAAPAPVALADALEVAVAVALAAAAPGATTAGDVLSGGAPFAQASKSVAAMANQGDFTPGSYPKSAREVGR